MTKGDTKKSKAAKKSKSTKKSKTTKKSKAAKKPKSIKKSEDIKEIESIPVKKIDTVKSISKKLDAAKSVVVNKSVPIKKLDAAKSVPIKTPVVAKPIIKDKSTCCPEFDPKSWDKKEIKWKGKFFVKDTVISAFHIPLNFGLVMKKNCKKIEAAKASTEKPVVVVDELSPFYSHVYIEVTKPVVDCDDVKLTGNFLSKTFEGPYKNMKKWIAEMDEYVKSKGKITKKNYFFYPTCPKCSKKYGKNYVVILAEF